MECPFENYIQCNSACLMAWVFSGFQGYLLTRFTLVFGSRTRIPRYMPQFVQARCGSLFFLQFEQTIGTMFSRCLSSNARRRFILRALGPLCFGNAPMGSIISYEAIVSCEFGRVRNVACVIPYLRESRMISFSGTMSLNSALLSDKRLLCR